MFDAQRQIRFPVRACVATVGTCRVSSRYQRLLHRCERQNPHLLDHRRKAGPIVVKSCPTRCSHSSAVQSLSRRSRHTALGKTHCHTTYVHAAIGPRTKQHSIFGVHPHLMNLTQNTPMRAFREPTSHNKCGTQNSL